MATSHTWALYLPPSDWRCLCSYLLRKRLSAAPYSRHCLLAAAITEATVFLGHRSASAMPHWLTSSALCDKRETWVPPPPPPPRMRPKYCLKMKPSIRIMREKYCSKLKLLNVSSKYDYDYYVLRKPPVPYWKPAANIIKPHPPLIESRFGNHRYVPSKPLPIKWPGHRWHEKSSSTKGIGSKMVKR
jgi:hypothetical protein